MSSLFLLFFSTGLVFLDAADTGGYSETNMLSNGDFATGDLTSWSFTDTASCFTESVNASNELEIYTDCSTGAFSMLSQDFGDLTDGATYTIEWQAKHTTGADLKVAVRGTSGSSKCWDTLGWRENAAVGTDWTAFSLSFVANNACDGVGDSGPKFRIELHYTEVAGETWTIDDLIVCEAASDCGTAPAK